MEEKYRSHMMNEEGKEIQWRYGSAPEYSVVNKLFEQGRTKEWPSGSLEETVQNVVKSWEMELSHKTCLDDFRSINPSKFKFSVNGKRFLSAEETLNLGSYNALLQSQMPLEMQSYRAEEESFDSSHHIFGTAFPRGFAWELLKLFSGPPEITFKFRHWGYMEGPYKGHGPTGEVVEFIGMAIIKVDENLKAEQVEIFYDPGDLFGGLLKGPKLSSEESAKQDHTDSEESLTVNLTPTQEKCPFSI
ncbi:hypothetical protein M5K25_021518 [Dendrobium thyrsiflorum]|uniref:Pathogen-related protein n=1 Tax=Dendrobium thyrsiflorum TaxID=117978 RepID=A0ABD0UJJ1_DENTH